MHGEKINPSSKALFWKMLKSEVIQRSFNRTAVWNFPKQNWLLRRWLGSIDGDTYLVQIPFHVSFGCNIPLDPVQRRVFDTKDSFHPGKKGNWEIIAPVTIGNDVWIGAGTIILPGVTIGSGSTIGAGSVVTHDIPPNVLSFGVPCNVVREITDENRNNEEK